MADQLSRDRRKDHHDHAGRAHDRGTSHAGLQAWVDEVAALTTPAAVHWVDGSDQEWDRLTDRLVEAGTFTRLNPDKKPNSFHAPSDPNDVARVEDRTFICSEDEKDAGFTNNWMAPDEMKEIMRDLYAGSMTGRTMYVIPFVMGHLEADVPMFGVEITDSAYVVVSMRIMARIGTTVLAPSRRPRRDFVKGLHSVGFPLTDGQADVPWPCSDTKYIAHFPETREHLVLRLGLRRQRPARQEVLRPADRLGDGPRRGLDRRAHAHPQAHLTGGHGLLHRRRLPQRLRQDQPRDDRPHPARVDRRDPRRRHRLDALRGRRSPVRGQPRVRPLRRRPGTGEKTNPNAMRTIEKGNSIFTNVALTDDGDIWWEGMTARRRPPTDWKGRTGPRVRRALQPPQLRFCTPIQAVPDPRRRVRRAQGVPISAILFGGRRKTTVPLVSESRDWAHGVFMGATLSSETTAAATGAVGVVRRDPMAMLPFIGYNAGDYFTHWIEIGKDADADKLPKIF